MWIRYLFKLCDTTVHLQLDNSIDSLSHDQYITLSPEIIMISSMHWDTKDADLTTCHFFTDRVNAHLDVFGLLMLN